MVIWGYRVGSLLKKTGSEVLADDVLSLAAAVAYNFFFSLFPLFLFAAPLIGVIGNEQATVNWLMQQLASVVPPDAIALVRNVVRDVVFSPNAPGIVSIGAVLSAWSGANIFRTLMDALNHAYDLQETRGFFTRALISLTGVIVTGGLIFIASTITIAGPDIAQWLGDHLGFSQFFVVLWTVVGYLIAFAIVVLAFFLIYRFMPNVRQSGRQILAGAVVATVLWMLVTLAFRLYVAHFGSYNKTYGTIGGVIVLLTWMYLTSLVILAVGELLSELSHGTGAIEPRKGAVYHGRVVTARDPSRPSTERIVRAPISARSSEHDGRSAMG